MSFVASTTAVPAAAGGSGASSAGKAPAAATPASAPPAASAAAASSKRLETFSGTGGSLPDVNTPSARVTQEALLREGFVLHADVDKLHTDLCKAWAGGGGGGAGGGGGKRDRVLPLVCPSVEQYGAVVGLQLEEREPLLSARELADAAAEEGAAAGSSSSSAAAAAEAPAAAAAAAAAAAQRGYLPPQPLRDRNTYLPYRWMFSPLHERSAALRDRLEEMVGALGAGAAVPAEAMTIGRICAEAEASRINTASVSLELARGGGVMKLDLREVPRFAVFPGQIVGVQGASTGADRLAVTDLHTGGAAPYARMPLANARALARVRGKGGPTRVWVAAGPFTDPKDMNFEPLQEFLAEATQAEEGRGPNVLVLQGPFVDADHPLIRSTAPEAIDRDTSELVPSTFKEVWLSVLNIIETYLTQPGAEGIEVVLQPSTGDAHADPVFPQWPMAREDIAAESEGFRARITLLPNPASWVCGDLVWGSSSTDIVFHLNSEEAGKVGVAAGEARPDRFASLANHLVEQRSYYPLYPAHGGAGGGGGGGGGEASGAGAVPLEVTQLWSTGMPCSPDVLVLPTRLGRPCVRVVGGGTVVVNPGSLARNKSYAKVAVFPPVGLEEQAAMGATHVSAMAPSRVRVDIERIIIDQ